MLWVREVTNAAGRASRAMIGVLLLQNLIGCGSGGSSEPAPASEVSGVSRLSETGDVVIGTGARPEIVAVGDKLAVTYLLPSTSEQQFRLLVVDRALNVLSDEAIFAGQVGHKPTDIRVAPDGACGLWYACETIDLALDSTFLQAARYDLCDDVPSLVASTQTQALATQPRWDIIDAPVGLELLNDPAPLLWGGSYHIATRYWREPRYQVYELSSSLEIIDQWDLELDSYLSGPSTQSTLVSNGSDILLVQGDAERAPCPADAASSNLVGLSIASDLRAGTDSTALSTCADFEMYAIGARWQDGRLYVTYQVDPGTNCDGGVGPAARPSYDLMLKVFDTSDGFALLDMVHLVAADFRGEHPTVEVDGDQIWVAFAADGELHIKSFAWEEAPSDWTPAQCL